MVMKFSDKLWEHLQADGFFEKEEVTTGLDEIFSRVMKGTRIFMWCINGFNNPIKNVRDCFKQKLIEDIELTTYYKGCKAYSHGNLNMDKTAINVAREVNRRLTYTSDKSNWGHSEYWATPIEIHRKKKDDCDGYAVLTCYVCGLLGIPAYRRFVRAGNVTTDSGGNFGHATFVFLSTKNNQLYPLEGSFYSARSFSKYDKVPMVNRKEYTNTWWLTNEVKSFGNSWFTWRTNKMVDKKKTTNYSLKIGAAKSFNKVLITWCLPAILYLLNNYAEWIPANKVATLAPVMGFVTYLVHNFFKMKKA